MAAAGRHVLSDASRERRNRRRRELRLQKRLELEEERRPTQQEAEDAAESVDEPLRPPPAAATLLPILASAAASSFRFLDDHGHLLLPSQALSLESSLSKLHSLLLRPPFPPPPPAPEACGSGHGCSGGKYWFLRFLASAASDGANARWVEAFRMSRSSFYLLLQTLAPSLSSHSSAAATLPPRPPPDHKLGAALFRLAHAAPFCAVARRFGMGGGAAAACRAFYEVCRSVTDRLGHLFELPSDVKRVVQGFRWASSLPNCGGVLGFARFPAGGGDDGGVVAQVVVDSEGRFLDVSAGWPGTMPPAQILPRTKLFSSPTANGLPGDAGGNEENGVLEPSPPRYLLGGSCCPLMPWLVTPFLESDIAEEEDPSRRVFNEVHGQGMKLAVKAVEAVRLRWRLLLAGWSGECAEALPFVIVVSCLLHNFLFKCSEVVPEEALELAREERFPDFEGKGDEEAERVRQALAAHLYSVVSQKG